MKYQNLTDKELVIPSVGIIKPNAEFEFDGVIENSKIAIVTEKKGK